MDRANGDPRVRWRVVVAHYREPLDWLLPLMEQSREQASVYVYHKGGMGRGAYAIGNLTGLGGARLRWIDCDNIGREAETFARHLFDHYDGLATMTAFLQGNPVASHFGKVLRETIRAMQRAPVARPVELARSPAWRCRLLGSPLMSVDGDGCKSHCGLAISPTCDHLSMHGARRGRAFGLAAPSMRCQSPFWFASGGQFLLSRAAAHTRPRSLYGLIVRQLHAEAKYNGRQHLYPYIYERLWQRIWNCSWVAPSPNRKNPLAYMLNGAERTSPG